MITEDELWPVYYIEPARKDMAGSARLNEDRNFDLPDELVKKYKQVTSEFVELSKEIAQAYNDRDIEGHYGRESFVDEAVQC